MSKRALYTDLRHGPLLFAFLLLTRWFDIMRDFAGQPLGGFGNETVVVRNQSVPKSLACESYRNSWIYLYFSTK
jgi:hypothetical protein